MGFGVSKCICAEVGSDKEALDGGEQKRSKFGFSPHKKHHTPSMSKVERALKAALLIQRWYRRYCARLEIRRRYTWTIFQSIEYAGEQDQMKLYNFFNALLTHMANGKMTEVMEALSPRASPTTDDDEDEITTKRLLEEAWTEEVPVEGSYKGPRLTTPLTTDSIHLLIEAFKKKKQTLHARYVYLLLREGVRVLRQRATIMHASTAISGQITVIGDLHGKLDDLLTLLYKNGLPSTDNPYVFNGDFVDRGRKSIEVLLLLLALVIVFPAEVYLNRGNHEDMVMNARYGFCKEVSKKYKAPHGPRILRLLEEVYRWLPLATVIDHKVMVVHGGISLDTDLRSLATADRSKYTSVLRAPAGGLAEDEYSLEEEVEGESDACREVRLLSATYEWKQVLDLLWSDPHTHPGCRPNSFRGGGSYFGPDVTKEFLDRHGLVLLIRSHECKPEGYEFTHDGRCLTIFSASNYYESGSNRGAYVKLQGPNLTPHFVQYTADLRTRKLTIRERVGRMETSAFRDLRGQILASRTKLLEAFETRDKENTGHLSVADWVDVMEKECHLNLPWRVLKDKLVTLHPTTGEVNYRSSFSDDLLKNDLTVKGGPTLVEALYRHKSSLETIFRLIDKDNSGYISMEEFSETCELLSRHIDVPIPKKEITDLARCIDINKDGYIDFNEFLECFRIVQSTKRHPEEDYDGDDDNDDDDDDYDEDRDEGQNGGMNHPARDTHL
ncbi:serine/threonine-protein phosphatase with EF-hands 2-like isoform X2 [Portunus trituberculatus]|uniref:serine/threonine-protein phosphatase with EF-hands 2-like isoform X2 n=1 Tax=Portunus trituberculatus TaxID=210409 RepID=UPI001E1D1057|nr:serine/threonine-protein phosphatase with EF-hands 2-like isoform X2 [Portunus trituberculatus]